MQPFSIRACQRRGAGTSVTPSVSYCAPADGNYLQSVNEKMRGGGDGNEKLLDGLLSRLTLSVETLTRHARRSTYPGNPHRSRAVLEGQAAGGAFAQRSVAPGVQRVGGGNGRGSDVAVGDHRRGGDFTLA